MGKPSWLVTLTPLLLAILQMIESYLNDSFTPEKVTLVIGALIAFIGSGAVGAYSSASKRNAKQG